MTGIFTFDGPMYKDCNGIYCNTTITNEMLNRFCGIVDKIYVIIRTIHLGIPYQEAKLQKLETSGFVEIVELPNLNTPKHYIFRKQAVKLINTYVENTDMVFLRIPSIISNIAANKCIKIGKPYYAEVGGCAWDSYYNHGIMGKIIAPVMYFSERRTVNNASFVSYVTTNWLQKRYPTTGRSISASNVYLQAFDEKCIENRINKYNKVFDSYRLGTIASVDVRYKGQEYVIRALGKLKKEGIILKYDLVGGGDISFLKKIAQDNNVEDQVRFLGLKLHNEIWSWLDEIDIYIQPSKQEGLPRAMIEAMSRGCLAMGSNVAGIPELIDDDMVFRRGNINNICSIIKLLISERDHKNRIIRNYEKAKEFDITILEKRRQSSFIAYKNEIVELL